jgi:hypothetical protein
MTFFISEITPKLVVSSVAEFFPHSSVEHARRLGDLVVFLPTLYEEQRSPHFVRVHTCANQGGKSMVRKLLFAAAALVTIGLLGPATAVARAPVVLSGGGTGTFDGVHPGSQFGMGIVFRGAKVQGHFNCVMAGRSAFAGLRLMKVAGQVTAGSASLAAGTATFSGTGTLHMNNAKSQVAFTVKVTRGGPGVGTLQLTVNGPPVGLFPLPVEHVSTGRISIH